jgi:hypothetical protein
MIRAMIDIMIDVNVYSWFAYCSACVPEDMPRAEIEAAVNAAHPAGTWVGWKISENVNFREGRPNPCQCEVEKDRLHYLLNC